ncbi:MAG: RidA family protein [Bacteroidetes bacterium]|nr:RidA family protein [Bacteroidota bacterium]
MIEQLIKELGYDLDGAPAPLAEYIPAVQADKLVFTAGQIPIEKGTLKYLGKVGCDVSIEEGKKAAELCAINGLRVIRNLIGDLNKIERVVKVTVFVNSADEFTDQPKVANGASELLFKIFGEKGRHVRSAVGVNELPINAAVEVEMIIQLKD